MLLSTFLVQGASLNVEKTCPGVVLRQTTLPQKLLRRNSDDNIIRAYLHLRVFLLLGWNYRVFGLPLFCLCICSLPYHSGDLEPPSYQQDQFRQVGVSPPCRALG